MTSTNMRKPKIYLETTLFNYYFDKDRDAHADTVRLFKEIAEGKYEAYTSFYVIDELKKAKEPKRGKMIALVEQYGITVFALDKDAEKLADAYVEQGIIPLRYRMDGIHVAIAALNDLDMIISLNFEHIVNRKTKLGTAGINALHNCRIIEIFSPMEVKT